MDLVKRELDNTLLQNETFITDGVSNEFHSVPEDIETITKQLIEKNRKIWRREEFLGTRNNSIPDDTNINNSDPNYTTQLHLVTQELDDTVLQNETFVNDIVSNGFESVPEDMKTIMKQIIAENRNIWNRDFSKTRNNSIHPDMNIDNSDAYYTAPLDTVKQELHETIVKHEPEDISTEFQSDADDVKPLTNQIIEENGKIWCRDDFSETWNFQSIKSETSDDFNAGTDSTVNIFSILEVNNELNEKKVENVMEDSLIRSEKTYLSELRCSIHLEQSQQNCDLPTSTDCTLLNPKNHKCHICGYTFSQKDSLQIHVQSVHLNRRNFKCYLCDFTSSWASSIRTHMNSVHLNRKNHKCHLCDYRSSQKSHIQRHVQSVHMKLRNYKCYICDFKTSWREALQTHINSVHLKLRTHKCHLCNFSSSQKTPLQIHLKSVHLKLKNYKCPLCDHTSSLKGNLQTHINSIHLNLDKHKCHLCDYSSKVKSALQSHIESVHWKLNNFKCHLCDYASSRRVILQMHIRSVHLKLINHKCDICDFACSSKGSLHKHIGMKHSHHECPLCDFFTSTKSQLQIHIDSIHL